MVESNSRHFNSRTFNRLFTKLALAKPQGILAFSNPPASLADNFSPSEVKAIRLAGDEVTAHNLLNANSSRVYAYINPFKSSELPDKLEADKMVLDTAPLVVRKLCATQEIRDTYQPINGSQIRLFRI